MAGDGRGFEGAIASEGGEVGGEGLWRDVGGFGDAGLGEIGEEVAEVSGVGFDGGWG